MGKVVDATGRVNGLEKLRIVDASIMPSMTSGNLNAQRPQRGLECSRWQVGESETVLCSVTRQYASCPNACSADWPCWQASISVQRPTIMMAEKIADDICGRDALPPAEERPLAEAKERRRNAVT